MAGTWRPLRSSVPGENTENTMENLQVTFVLFSSDGGILSWDIFGPFLRSMGNRLFRLQFQFCHIMPYFLNNLPQYVTFPEILSYL